MFRKGIIIVSLAALVAVSSCGDRSCGVMSLPYAREILADTSSFEHKVLSDFIPSVHGTIAVVGDVIDAPAVAEAFLCCDLADNVTGKARSDGLPDFAGERIAAYVDEAVGYYGDYFSRHGQDSLRELALRNLIAALDTSCVTTKRGKLVVDNRAAPKLLVVASTYAASLGRGDLDSLCTALGISLPVVYSTDAAFEYALGGHGPRGLYYLIAGGDKIQAQLYAKAWKRAGGSDGDLRVLPLADSTDVRQACNRLLDQYLESGSSKQIAAILVDDPSADAAVLQDYFDKLKSSASLGDFERRNALTSDFELIFFPYAVAATSFKYLRETNAFTHRVAMPEALSYITYSSTPVALKETYMKGSQVLLTQEELDSEEPEDSLIVDEGLENLVELKDSTAHVQD